MCLSVIAKPHRGGLSQLGGGGGAAEPQGKLKKKLDSNIQGLGLNDLRPFCLVAVTIGL